MATITYLVGGARTSNKNLWLIQDDESALSVIASYDIGTTTNVWVIVKDADGNYYIATEENKIYKYNSNMDLVTSWATNGVYTHTTAIWSMAVDKYGYLAVGFATTDGNTILLLDATGNLVWTKPVAGTGAYGTLDCRFDASGNVIGIGYRASGSNCGSKLNRSDGAVLQTYWDKSGANASTGVDVYSDGDVIITDLTQARKCDSLDEQDWITTVSPANNIQDIAIDSSENVYLGTVVGTSKNLYRLNSSGVQTANYNTGASFSGAGHRITMDENGNLITVGSSSTDEGGNIAKLRVHNATTLAVLRYTNSSTLGSLYTLCRLAPLGEVGYERGGGGNVWLSRTGDYENFEEGVKDSDSFSLEIPTTNSIQWIESIEALLVGTSGDEWKIGSNNLDTPLTPTNFSVKQQSSYGSFAIQAIRVNEVILFVDFVGRKVRELTYSDQALKYVAPDLTALAEHITLSGIVCYAHQRNPDSILWCVLDNGSLISMTYEREQNTVAWSKHPIDGLVQSVCVIPNIDEDEIYLSVSREETVTHASTINDIIGTVEIVDYEGETVAYEVVYIEKMMPRTPSESLSDNFFVDSGITFVSITPTITIKGLTHLIGKVVAALADGIDVGTKIVDENGEIELDAVASKVQAGLPFTSLLEPVRLDIQTQSGTTYGSIKKIHKIIVNFLNAAGAQYGRTVDELHDFKWTDESLINTSEVKGLFTGQIGAAFDGGFETEDTLVITSSAPLPCVIRSIVLRMEKTGE